MYLQCRDDVLKHTTSLKVKSIKPVIDCFIVRIKIFSHNFLTPLLFINDFTLSVLESDMLRDLCIIICYFKWYSDISKSSFGWIFLFWYQHNIHKIDTIMLQHITIIRQSFFTNYIQLSAKIGNKHQFDMCIFLSTLNSLKKKLCV